jgi:hypothetical protein
MGFPQPLLYQLRLSLSGDRFACVLDSFAGLLAHGAELFLYLATGSLGFTLAFKIPVAGHLTDLAFDRSLDLFSFSLNFVIIPHDILLLRLDWSDAARALGFDAYAAHLSETNAPKLKSLMCN